MHVRRMSFSLSKYWIAIWKRYHTSVIEHYNTTANKSEIFFAPAHIKFKSPEFIQT
jgi:hypothetical protein